MDDAWAAARPLPRTRAAAYVRMSTEHQRYSTENQMVVISAYAAAHGMQLGRIYADPARSGLTLKGRLGLQQLLGDVERRNADFNVVLVYDVSRWGRFQNVDESAYYEYLCRRMGVKVVYCAEMFEDDGSLAAMILKHLRRMMAAEFSRDLSVKVSAGKSRLAGMGYYQGAPLVFGYRRLLLDEAGNPKGYLERRQYKAFQRDRVVLVPGPRQEQALVRRMFELYVHEHLPIRAICQKVNRLPAKRRGGIVWGQLRMSYLLANELYVGNYIVNRTTVRLRCLRLPRPKEEWVRCDGAFPPIVPHELFRLAQEERLKRRQRISDEEILKRLKNLWQREGRITRDLIAADRSLPCACAIRRRLGTFEKIYQMIDYKPRRSLAYVVAKAGLDDIRHRLIDEMRSGFERVGGDVIPEAGGQILLINQEWRVGLRPLYCCQKTDQMAWRWNRYRSELDRVDVLVLACLNETGGVHCFFLVPRRGSGCIPSLIEENPPPGALAFRSETLDGLFAMARRADITSIHPDLCGSAGGNSMKGPQEGRVVARKPTHNRRTVQKPGYKALRRRQV